MLLALFLALQAPLAARPDTGQRPHDALHHDITIILGDSGRHILGEIETTWVLGSADPLVIPLDSAMRVVRVLKDGRENTRLYRTEYGRDGNIIYVPTGKQAGDTLHTRVRWHGEPRDGLVVREGPGGTRTFFADNWPDRAHLWLPVQDHPSDKATVTWRVEAPAGYRVIANGTLLGVDTLPRGHTVWRYRLDRPIPPSNLVLGAGALAVTRLPDACAVSCVPQSVWSDPADSAFAAGRFEVAPRIVDWLSRLLGPFPYPSLAHVQSSTIFGGMENATAIFYATELFRKRTLDESTIAHETAHQWFGDAVTELDWHHLWLSEGFATYLAAMWIGEAHGPRAFDSTMAAAAEAVKRAAREPGPGGSAPVTSRPILDTAATDLMGLLNTNNYPKGAWVLHSLRGLVGDSAFVRGLRQFYARYRDRTALSADFQATMEEAAGRPLGWYFTQALTQPGYPVLAVTATRVKPKRYELEIRQVQDPAWGLYQLPGLVVRYGNTDVAVDVRGEVTKAVLDLREDVVSSFVVDPDHRWLLDWTLREAGK